MDLLDRVLQFMESPECNKQLPLDGSWDRCKDVNSRHTGDTHIS